MTVEVTQNWLELEDIRRRRLNRQVWIPLRQSENIIHAGVEHQANSKVEFIGVNCVAIPVDQRGSLDLSWGHLGLTHDGGPIAISPGNYKPAECYRVNDLDDVGVDLVMVQHTNSGSPSIWHVNQDLILALNLIQDGDYWVRPEEGFARVIRHRKREDGSSLAIEIKAEYLKDYLAARELGLHIGTYQSRIAIVEDCSFLDWTDDEEFEVDGGRLSKRQWMVDATGNMGDQSVSVLQMWRTDEVEGEDVPVMPDEGPDNTGSRSFAFDRQIEESHYRFEGEFWRDEWLAPAPTSERVRGDDPASPFTYIVEADGATAPHTDLNYEDVGRWLWFRPEVINKLISVKGGGLAWFTGMTGNVWCSPIYNVHWGLNDIGLVNVYASDICKLPAWQQKVWQGENVTPEGGVSRELYAAQMHCNPASTIAAEEHLTENLKAANEAFYTKTEKVLLDTHLSHDEIVSRSHRFIATSQPELLKLSKDINRISNERLNKSNLRLAIGAGANPNWGTLRLLQAYLEALTDHDTAFQALSPLVGINELRKADAHLPASDYQEAFDLVNVDTDTAFVIQGAQLIQSAANAWENIHRIISA